MKKGYILLAGAALIAGACTQTELRNSNLKGHEFRQALAREYKILSESETYQGDPKDSEYFAKKGLISHKGGQVAPDTLADRALKQEDAKELGKARKRLEKVLAKDELIINTPTTLARAQAGFDCWAEQTEEYFQVNEYIPYREAFLKRLAALENPTKFTVHYSSGSAKASMNKTAKRVAAELAKRPGHVVRLSAHTDRAGKDDKNLVLSDMRANGVVGALVAAGIPENRIVASPYGEMKNRKKTKDGVSSKTNRRVEIFVTE